MCAETRRAPHWAPTSLGTPHSLLAWVIGIALTLSLVLATLRL